MILRQENPDTDITSNDFLLILKMWDVERV